MDYKVVERLCTKGIISWLDVRFAKLIAELDAGDSHELFFAAALTSSKTREGHICINLKDFSGQVIISADESGKEIVLPEYECWVKALQGSDTIGKPGDFKPLILDTGSRLYLQRYFSYEQSLATGIKSRTDSSLDTHIDGRISERMSELFPESGETDWQKVAAATALLKKFCVISGGPGTGKTTTVAKILTLLLSGDPDLRIVMCAPTGKAAARLEFSVKSAKASLKFDKKINELIPEKASTLHRLLGTIPHSPYFRYDKENKLPYDIVIVDEASMVDLALMAKLVNALEDDTRLILLGDKDQLSSVESGSVMGDICDTGYEHDFSRDFLDKLRLIIPEKELPLSSGSSEVRIADCVIELKKSYRFTENSGIGAVSKLVNEGKGSEALSLIGDGEYEDIKWRGLPASERLRKELSDAIIYGYSEYLRARDPHKKFNLFESYRILCAMREGPYGVKEINRIVEDILASKGLINPSKEWYEGRPVLITKNDYNLGLYNGDVGIALKTGSGSDSLRVCFIDPGGNIRTFHPFRLPGHETVFAMTIHKSQGSEFDRVLMILPDRESPVFTRELIYTGITRAKQEVDIRGAENVFMHAVSKRIKRESGLRQSLWN